MPVSGAAAMPGQIRFEEPSGAAPGPMNVFLHRPAAWRPGGPVVVVMHGMGRNADGYRDAWVAPAEVHGFLLICPEYSNAKFPGVRFYNHGNAQAAQAEWTFFALDRAVEAVLGQLGAAGSPFALYGHSAGAQFGESLRHCTGLGHCMSGLLRRHALSVTPCDTRLRDGESPTRHSPGNTKRYSESMSGETASSPRSFRLSPSTAEMLDRRADELGQSRNALVERLLAEGLRREEHPMVWFRSNAAGVRTAAIVGRRIYIWQVIDALRTMDGAVAEVADDFSLTELQVRAVVDYYAAFSDEVDADAERSREFIRRERERREKAATLTP
jgi:uncharacterized protein (DUF433 family)